MGNKWSQAARRVVCCGPGAQAAESINEHVYEEIIDEHQAEDVASTLPRLVASVDEILRTVAPIADVQERMRRLELNLHPLLVYRPEDGEYMDMLNGPGPCRPAPAAQVPEPPECSVWQTWLHERIDYGEPW